MVLMPKAVGGGLEDEIQMQREPRLGPYSPFSLPYRGGFGGETQLFRTLFWEDQFFSGAATPKKGKNWCH